MAPKLDLGAVIQKYVKGFAANPVHSWAELPARCM